MTASGEGLSISASAADFSEQAESAQHRCHYELLERISILRALGETKKFPVHNIQGDQTGQCDVTACFKTSPSPELWCFAKSNGVAAGTSFQDSAMRAAAELMERDRLLRFWYSDTTPQRMGSAIYKPLQFLDKDFHFTAINCSNPMSPSEIFHVIALFGFPKDPNRPMIFGFGSAETPEAAGKKACSEFLQRLCFLWEEATPTEEPEFSASPHFHQEYFLHPQHQDLLKNWLNGKSKLLPMPDFQLNDFRFIDLTQSEQKEKIWILKATHPLALELTFGRWNPAFDDSTFNSATYHRSFQTDRWLHFIP